MQSVIMLIVIMRCVLMQSVIMLSAINIQPCHAEIKNGPTSALGLVGSGGSPEVIQLVGEDIHLEGGSTI
jgi:hypothetical protein